ncbi:MAG: hypothetical protein EOO66_25235, partial [Methylobacterium sp.]
MSDAPGRQEGQGAGQGDGQGAGQGTPQGEGGLAFAVRHCEDLVRAGDPDRYFATLFAPPAFRPHLFALYAFSLTIARVREAASNPMAGEIRLQWWRDAL